MFLGRRGQADVIDAAAALLTNDGDDIVTSDTDDLYPMVEATGRHAELFRPCTTAHGGQRFFPEVLQLRPHYKLQDAGWTFVVLYELTRLPTHRRQSREAHKSPVGFAM